MIYVKVGISLNLKLKEQPFESGVEYIVTGSEYDIGKFIPFFGTQNEIEKKILDIFKQKLVVFDNSKIMVVRKFNLNEEKEFFVFNDNIFSCIFSYGCEMECRNSLEEYIFKIMKNGSYGLFYDLHSNQYIECFDEKFKVLNKTGEFVYSNFRDIDFYYRRASGQLKKII